jgi:hypothetical protein
MAGWMGDLRVEIKMMRAVVSFGMCGHQPGAAWLPAFHTCVGTGEERHMTKWYKDNGRAFSQNPSVCFASQLCYQPMWKINIAETFSEGIGMLGRN